MRTLNMTKVLVLLILPLSFILGCSDSQAPVATTPKQEGVNETPALDKPESAQKPGVGSHRLKKLVRKNRAEVELTEKELLPFSIHFDIKGNPIILDRNGEVVKPTKNPGPIPAEAVATISSITAVEIHGSLCWWIKVDGMWWKFCF